MHRFQIGLFIIMTLTFAYTQETGSQLRAATGTDQSCSITDSDRAAKQIAENWKSGYNGADAYKVASLYTQDAYYLTQHFATGILHGRSSIRAYVQRGIDAGYHIDSIQVLSTDCSGDLAYSIARYESTNNGQKALGVNLVVMRKVGNVWQIVAHEAAVPDPTSAIQHLDQRQNAH